MASALTVLDALEQRLLQKVRASDPQLAGAARAQAYPLLAAQVPLCLRAALVRALFDVDPKAPERLGHLLASGPLDQRRHCLEAVAESAARGAFELLSAYAADPSAELRALCALGLGRCGGPASAALLTERLAVESSARVLRQLAEACRELIDPQTAPPLRPLLRSDATAVRGAAAAALGRMNDRETLFQLADMLRGGDSSQRYAAAEALGETRMAAAVAPLTEALADSNPAVRRRAAYALGLVGGPASVAPLARALADPNAAVRSRSAYSLGSAADAAALAPLRAALSDPVVAVRRQAADALARIEAPGSAGILVALLEEPEGEIWHRAAWGLGRRGDRRALEALKRMLNDPEDRVRAHAVEGLDGLDARAELRSALTDPAAAVRRRVLRALASRGLARAELLAALSDPDPSVVEAACVLLLDPSRL